MKLRINKNIRLGLSITIVITTIILAYLIYNEAYNLGYEEKTTSVYSYSNIGSVNYEVYLKPNNLYTHNKLEEGKLYITEFVDHVYTNLKYEFIGEREAEIKGNYNIIAKVNGYSGEGEGLINIWEKEFPIIQYKRINTSNGKVLINEKVKLNINEYNLFVKDIKETSKINCQAALTLYMNINLTGITDKGAFEEFISPNLIIPLDVAMFEISGSSIIDQPGAIEETIQMQLPINRNLIMIYGIIIFMLIIALIILIFFTTVKPIKDQLEKEINKIFKKHGDRLVALDTEMDIDNSIAVKTIEDLVRISDEIGKPIFYRYSENYKEINKFYVTCENEIYLLDLSSLIIDEIIEDIKNSENTEQILTES